MKNLRKLILGLALFSLTAEATQQNGQRRPQRQRLSGPSTTTVGQQAVGVVDVYFFKNRSYSMRCAATHIGDGLMVTAGHCFLGAYDCNDAVVSWENENYTSRCQYVLYSNASEAYASGREISNDLTIFKVNRYPETRVSLAPGLGQLSTNVSTEAVAISKTQNNGAVETTTSAACQIVFGPIVNIFAQPKPSDTARHSCDVSDIASGSPLINAATKQLIAIHQGTSLLPDLESSPRGATSQKVNYAKVISQLDIQKAISLTDALPREIRIGGFAGEVFNIGISEPLNLKVARLQARVGESTISFGMHNGLDTIVEATDGDGKKMIFAGPRRSGHDQRLRLKAPVLITVTSAQNGIAPLAWIEDIQSP